MSNNNNSNLKVNNIKKNLELFKLTFQKPSQIYKFLKENWKEHPLYLNRSLSYISKHRTKTYRERETKIDLIARKLYKQKSMSTQETKDRRQGQSNHNISRNNSNNNKGSPSGIECDDSNNVSDRKISSEKIYFNWICSNPERTSQKTRSTGYICPWCEKDYIYSDSLMFHLKCCHPRFNFNLVEEDGKTVIDMTLNSSFDGSYCGFKYPGHNLRHDFRFTNEWPTRRVPLTLCVYFRAKKRNRSSIKHALISKGDNLDDDEADVDVHGRLFYHTSTCLPVKPNEVDIDSEADIDPEWLRERTQLMIDEFTDVNEGEKEILKLWNLHIMKNYKYKGDNMIPQACLDFVESEGHTILSKNLYKNLVLHLANLYDFGLVSSGDIIECIRMLKKLESHCNNNNNNSNNTSKTSSKIKLERNSNEHCQHSPPAKRALLNSHCNQ